MDNVKILMMFLGTGGEVDERMKGSLRVAQKLNAHLKVIHTQMDPNSLLPDDLSIPSVARSKLTRVMDDVTADESSKLKKKFKALCEELEVPFHENHEFSAAEVGASWMQVQGLRSNLVGSYGKLADWIIMAKPPEGKVTASFEAAVLETGRPVLIIPRDYEDPHFDRILLGWNYRAEAVRAMSTALPLMQAAKNVKVVTSTDYQGFQPPMSQVVEYLALHGIDAESSVIECPAKQAGKVLLKQCKDDNVDLIVIGAYSKRRIRDLLFGDVTRYLLRKSTLPILMVH
jgi:nucleotide-binding universal stress UspA family protein